DRRQITLRRIAHCNRFGPECLVQCTEAIANSSVELLVFLEPVARLELVEPEPEIVIDPHAAHRHDKQRWGLGTRPRPTVERISTDRESPDQLSSGSSNFAAPGSMPMKRIPARYFPFACSRQ